MESNVCGMICVAIPALSGGTEEIYRRYMSG